MSWIWNVMLSLGDNEFFEDDNQEQPGETCEGLERINAWIPHGRLVDLVKPTYADGAGHGMHAYVYGGGFNHLDIEGFIAVVEAQDWKDRPNVQLWIKEEWDQSFTLVKLRKQPSTRAKVPRKPSAAVARKSPPSSRRPTKANAPRGKKGSRPS